VVTETQKPAAAGEAEAHPAGRSALHLAEIRNNYRRMPSWKRYAFVGAALLVLGGLFLRVAEATTGDAASTGVASNPAARTTETTPRSGPLDSRSPSSSLLRPDGLVAEGQDPRTPGSGEHTLVPTAPRGGTPDPGGGPSGGGASSAEGAGDAADGAWSLGFLKMGFSFFVGFSLGYAFRKFLQIALFFAGAFFALMFLLSYQGFVVVQWDVIDLAFSSMVSDLGDQLTRARSFVTGSLPQAGLASLGLVAGYKRN
jgi:uncharacterized membrane protein (Fun14 family)